MYRRLFMGSLLAAWGAMIPACGKQPVPAAPPTKAFVREAFKFDYPASWTIDEKDMEYDPDHRFSIDASDGAFVRFAIYDPKLDPSKALALMVTAHEKNMPGASKSEFKQWGKYAGAGVTLQGKVRSVVKSTVRLFTFNDSKRTFAVTEYVSDDEKQQLTPGFQVVEKSFQVNK